MTQPALDNLVDQVLHHFDSLPSDKAEELLEDADRITESYRCVPNPGPQTLAYASQADELGFGGEAGGGKSYLAVLLTLTAHERSLVLRRTNKEAGKFVEEFEKVIGSREGWNSQKNQWRLPGKLLEIGGCQNEDDKQKYKGDPHDLILFDEVVDFSESQYEFIITWNRTTTPGQRCRIVATFNPPTRPVGMWVMKRWGPWLDPKHPRPAKDGELRWYTTIDGRDTEVDGPGPHSVGGEMVMARSRTFIRSHLSDNPDLARTDYGARLAALPKELRAAYKEGRFDASLKDQPFQLIPTEWIRMAIGRWMPTPPRGVPMCAIGVDTSGGGEDPMVIAPRHDGWYAPLLEVPGESIPKERPGKFAAGFVVAERRDGAIVIVDMGGGYGGPLYEHLHTNGIAAKPHNGAEKSVRRTKDGKLKFTNKRTEVLWRFREALDPELPGGSPIMLPDDPELIADLAAPTFENTPQGLKAEAKEDVVKRLGRSTNKGDAVVMSWSAGPTYVTDGQMWAEAAEMGLPPGQRFPKVIMGRRHSAAYRR